MSWKQNSDGSKVVVWKAELTMARSDPWRPKIQGGAFNFGVNGPAQTSTSKFDMTQICICRLLKRLEQSMMGRTGCFSLSLFCSKLWRVVSLCVTQQVRLTFLCFLSLPSRLHFTINFVNTAYFSFSTTEELANSTARGSASRENAIQFKQREMNKRKVVEEIYVVWFSGRQIELDEEKLADKFTPPSSLFQLPANPLLSLVRLPLRYVVCMEH